MLSGLWTCSWSGHILQRGYFCENQLWSGICLVSHVDSVWHGWSISNVFMALFYVDSYPCLTFGYILTEPIGRCFYPKCPEWVFFVPREDFDERYVLQVPLSFSLVLFYCACSLTCFYEGISVMFICYIIPCIWAASVWYDLIAEVAVSRKYRVQIHSNVFEEFSRASWAYLL